jgi:PIN domain nuclease of toxin-antitoxin system
LILLDTHVLLWLAAEPKRLSKRAAAAIRRSLRSGGLGLASISLWEIAMLLTQGRVRFPGTVETALESLIRTTGVTVREISPSIAALATQFPEDFSKDPADRLIAATARADDLAFVTSDERLRASPLLRTIW